MSAIEASKKAWLPDSLDAERLALQYAWLPEDHASRLANYVGLMNSIDDPEKDVSLKKKDDFDPTDYDGKNVKEPMVKKQRIEYDGQKDQEPIIETQPDISDQELEAVIE